MPRPRRRTATPASLTALALGILLTACLPKATPPDPAPRGLAPVGGGAQGRSDGAPATLVRELVVLHDEFRAFVDAGGTPEQAFEPSDPNLRVADGRVAIDATASGDPALLERDLAVLGLEGASSFGPVVSGYLPILALHEAAALATLRLLTAAKASLR